MLYYTQAVLKGDLAMKNRIGELRREKGLTLKQLGKILSIKDNALSQYETGKRNPQLGLLQEIANFFKVSIEYLTYDTDKRDFPINSDSDAIKILKNIKSKKISVFNLSSETYLILAIWIIENQSLLKKDYPELFDTAVYLVHDVESEVKVLNWFKSDRLKEYDALNQIESLLMYNEDNKYSGANASETLEFLKQSDRIGSEKTREILKIMKNTPTLSDDDD